MKSNLRRALSPVLNFFLWWSLASLPSLSHSPPTPPVTFVSSHLPPNLVRSSPSIKPGCCTSLNKPTLTSSAMASPITPPSSPRLRWRTGDWNRTEWRLILLLYSWVNMSMIIDIRFRGFFYLVGRTVWTGLIHLVYDWTCWFYI